jgi:hypothetical protein
MPLTFFPAPEVGPPTLVLALTLRPLVCLLAFSLVAFSTFSVSLHTTLQCSNPHLPSL